MVCFLTRVKGGCTRFSVIFAGRIVGMMLLTTAKNNGRYRPIMKWEDAILYGKQLPVLIYISAAIAY